MPKQKIIESRNYSTMSRLLFVFLGVVIYGGAICADFQDKSWQKASFGLAFACFVGAFMTGEAERLTDDIVCLDDDLEAQALLDSSFENLHPKKIGQIKTVQIPSDRDFPTIPFTWG
ncbi:MAG: hypothetical protein AUK48_00385 [Oscillatoriales cyanobacterium CG2_30_44_21]|nr:MAG: hypothetical protein AUK48_00385 [Oscillatoriales cyanobacterium CG2_30_44_21]